MSRSPKAGFRARRASAVPIRGHGRAFRHAEPHRNFVLQADQPQALIYEPLPGGAFRLVGVEFIVLASVWLGQPNGATSTPALEGDLMNYISAPNRYGLPAFYELHVWAWENNPKGSFADWNTHVTCEKQAAN